MAIKKVRTIKQSGVIYDIEDTRVDNLTATTSSLSIDIQNLQNPENIGPYNTNGDFVDSVLPNNEEAINQIVNASQYRFENVEGALDEKANVIRTFTATLTGGDWNNSTKQQTITAPFVAIKTTSIVWVSPASADYEKYVLAGVRAVSQGTDTITFQCETLPINTTAGNINVVIVSQYEPNL
jgi:hypothetical protein